MVDILVVKGRETEGKTGRVTEGKRESGREEEREIGTEGEREREQKNKQKAKPILPLYIFNLNMKSVTNTLNGCFQVWFIQPLLKLIYCITYGKCLFYV